MTPTPDFRPGTRGYALTGEEVIPIGDDGDGWYVDEIHQGGIVIDGGHFERLDLAYFYGHLIALARARTLRQGIWLSPVRAIVAADTIYIIDELLVDEHACHIIDAGEATRARACAAALALIT